MTEAQLALLDFVRERIHESGLAPTYGEMLRHLGKRSRANVVRMVDGLVMAGQLIRDPGRTRGLRLPMDVNVAGIPTERLEAELRRRRRAPAWSREFLRGLADPQLPIGIGGSRG